MEAENEIKKILRERNLTVESAAKLCGVSLMTMQIVAGGRPTLPQLALRIGKGLRLTREQLMPLGKPLDKDAWGKNGLPDPCEIDVDPAWWKRLPKWKSIGTDDHIPSGSWVNVIKVMETVIARDLPLNYLRSVLGDHTLCSLNGLGPAKRKEWIIRLEKELHVSPGSFAAGIRPRGSYFYAFAPDYSMICQVMERKGLSHEALANRLYNSKTGRQNLENVLTNIQGGIWFTPERAARWADALCVDLKEIGEMKVRTY